MSTKTSFLGYSDSEITNKFLILFELLKSVCPYSIAFFINFIQYTT